MDHEVIVIGGSYAGMAAALQIGRARRRVLVIDAGLRRNRFAAVAHGLLGRDGVPPAQIAAEARAQLAAYPAISWHEGSAASARADGAGFTVETGDGQRISARRLVLATGVTDTLPDIPGLAERWGKSVFHCPYCHGYELDNGNIGVLATGPMSLHHALMLPDWGRTTLLTNGAFEPSAADLEQLQARGVRVEHAHVLELIGEGASVRLDDGRTIAFDGLFTMPRTRPSSPLAEQLGCVLEDGPMGPFVKVDEMKQTNIAGVFACGDAARAAGSLALAVGDGTMAGVAAHRSLIFA